MKKLFLLAGLLLSPLFAFSQEVTVSDQATVNGEESLYNIDTAKKFYRVKDIIKDAEKCLQLPLKVNPKRGGYSCIYNIEEIKNNLEAENLDAFLKNENNEIVLASVAEHITDKNVNIYHDNYELLITIGIDPVEAAVRTGEERYTEEALNYGRISFSHWETYRSFGVMSAKEYIRERKVKTTKQEIKKIKREIENKKSLVDNFKKEMRKLRRHIRLKTFFDKTNRAIQKFDDKLETVLQLPESWMGLVNVVSCNS